MTSSIYPISVTPIATPISDDTDILASDIVITNDQVKPGGGGILRLYFSFNYNVPDVATISVRNNGVLKGNLNADNTAETITDGYYRFDIDVEQGDSINLRSSVEITTVHFIRAHLVQFGA